MKIVDFKVAAVAYKLYETIETEGSKSSSILQKKSGIADPLLFNRALDWLVHEDKIELHKKGRGRKVSLFGLGQKIV